MPKPFKGKLAPKILESLLARRKRKGLSVCTIGHRLEMYRCHLELKAENMAKLIGISQGSYSELQSDISQPSCGTIINLFNLAGNPVDVRWLLLGEE